MATAGSRQRPRRGPVSIRAATPADDEAIEEVRRLTWHDTYDSIWGATLIDDYFAGRVVPIWRGGIVGGTPPESFVAVGDEAVVGFITLRLRDDGPGQVTVFHVLPDRQGEGIGRRLWDTASEALRAAGCHELVVWVFARNPRARAFYEHRGGVLGETGEVVFGDHEPEERVAYRVPL